MRPSDLELLLHPMFIVVVITTVPARPEAPPASLKERGSLSWLLKFWDSNDSCFL